MQAFDDGVDIIRRERERQRILEGHSAEHDDTHVNGELAAAAVCYAARPHGRADIVDEFWPFGRDQWKPSPSDRIRELAKAGALIAAEIDRLLRKSP